MVTLVTGATGFVGRRLLKKLQDPVVLSRSAAKVRQLLGNVAAFDWNADSEPPPSAALDGVSAVIHLAGESVAKGRWTAAKRRRIWDSRVVGTRHLVDALEQAEKRPEVLVSASAIGYYGSRGDEELEESAAPGSDFLAELCVAWEQEARRAEEFGVRVVTPRIGLVLGRSGGAMSMVLPLFRFCLGGRISLSGRQWWSWIHVEDLASLLLFAARHDSLAGPVNAVSPNPATNRDFTSVLAKAMGRPAFFHAPAPALRIGLGGFANVLLASQRVIPRAALDAGFAFQYPELPAALAECLGRPA